MKNLTEKEENSNIKKNRNVREERYNKKRKKRRKRKLRRNLSHIRYLQKRCVVFHAYKKTIPDSASATPSSKR
jgi:hypothetical protein